MVVLITVLIAIVLTFAKAFLVKALWAWFLVPLGVLPISAPQALGVSALIAILTFSTTDLQVALWLNKQQSSEEKQSNALAIQLSLGFAYAVAFGICYFYTTLM